VTGDAKPEDKVFHGWKLVGALSCILFFTAGGGLYVFPVFIGSLQQEFGWSMTQVSGTGAVFAAPCLRASVRAMSCSSPRG